MRKTWLLFVFVIGLFSSNSLFSQINSNSPTVPFSSRTSYSNGILPTNLPTSGTYVKSQDAADAYNAWKTTFVQTCTNGSRVLFDDMSSTVSEGIAYGLLLSAYAGDKPLFDALWKYWKASSDSHGLMNWKLSGCTGTSGANSATDADEDAAMALIIAAEQWPTATSPYTYKSEATTIIAAIRAYDIDNSTYQIINGDAWGTSNTCRNPSYFAPAYYREFAKIETAQATFWNNAATQANTFLLKNRNATTGLVSNWADNNSNANSCNGNNEYGYDACRSPWRMANDVLWNGATTATTASDICTKMTAWIGTNGANLKGPLAQNASSPSAGTYKNGSFGTYGLAPMATSSTNQSILNTCYTNIVGLGNSEAYFSRTLRCITLFMMTGNFWKPGTSGASVAPTVTAATTSSDGLKITITFSIPVTFAAADYSKFTLKIGGTAVASAITAIAANGTSAVDLTIAAGKIAVGNVITLDYTPGTIKSTATTPVLLAVFSAQSVTNALAGNSTLIDDCEDGDGLNNLGGAWFTYNDAGNNGASTVAPLTTSTTPFTMASGGANASAMAVHITYTLNKGTNTNGPFIGTGIMLNKAETAVNWSNGTGMSFYYKGKATHIQLVIPGVTDYAYHYYAVPVCAAWTKITFTWAQLIQPAWGKTVAFTTTSISKVNWQVDGVTGDAGDFWIDDIKLEGAVPPAITSFTVSPTSKTLALVGDTVTARATILPANAIQKVTWVSSNTAVATVGLNGLVTAVSNGTATITATSIFDNTKTASCAITVGTPVVLPTSIALLLSPTSIIIGATSIGTAIITPSNATDKTVTWTSSNTAIATVSSSGVVTGVSIGGPVTITATSVSAGTIKGIASITVVKTPVTYINVSSTIAPLVIGNSITITATVYPVDATDKTVSWSSNNIAIATVKNGVITAVGVGSCMITVTSNDNANITQIVSVSVSGIDPTGIVVTSDIMDVKIGTQATLTATFTPANTTDKTVGWSSSDTSIAKVDVNGIVTPIAIGNVIITATSKVLSSVFGTIDLTISELSTTVVDFQLNSTVIVSAYPSPFTSELTVTSTTSMKSIELMTISGAIILDEITINQNEVKLQTDKLQNGFILIKINLENGTSKILKAIK